MYYSWEIVDIIRDVYHLWKSQILLWCVISIADFDVYHILKSQILLWCVISIADFVVQETLVTLYAKNHDHYSDVIMGAMASQIISLTIIYSTVYSGADQRKHKSSTSLAFVRGIHRWPVNSPHKGPPTRKMFPFDDVIMMILWQEHVFPVTDPLWGEPKLTGRFSSQNAYNQTAGDLRCHAHVTSL